MKMNEKLAFESALNLVQGCSDQFRMGFAHGYKAALEWAKSEQEPVAWAETDEHGEIAWGEEGCFSNDPAWIENPLPLYTHPVPTQPAVAELVDACKLLVRYHETADGVNMKSYFDAVKAAYSALKAVKES